MRTAVILIVFILTGFAARADDERRVIGSWMTINTEDHFGEGGSFLAATGERGGLGFVVRCIEHELSVGVIDMGNDPNPLTPGQLFSVKLRVDKGPIEDLRGKAINERLVQLVTSPELVKSIRKGSELAIRVENERGVSSTHVYPTRGAPKAFERLARECDLDAPADKPGPGKIDESSDKPIWLPKAGDPLPRK